MSKRNPTSLGMFIQVGNFIIFIQMRSSRDLLYGRFGFNFETLNRSLLFFNLFVNIGYYFVFEHNLIEYLTMPLKR